MLSCKFGQRMVLTRNGSVVYCKECRKCLPGFGLNPPCFNSGITVEPVTEACQRCVLGTFSSGTDSSRCKPCGRCPAHVLVKKNCTPLHKTECTMECEKPYYYSNGYCIKCCPCIQGAQNDLRCIGFGSLQCSTGGDQCPSSPVSAPTTSPFKQQPSGSSSSDGSARTLSTLFSAEKSRVIITRPNHHSIHQTIGPSASEFTLQLSIIVSLVSVLAVATIFILLAILHKRCNYCRSLFPSRADSKCFEEPVTQEDCIDNDIIWPEEPVTQEDCIDNDIIWPEEPFRQEDCINNDIIWPEENIEKRRIAHTLQNEYMPLVVNLSFTTKSYDDITESEDVLQESKHQAHNQGKPAVEASSSIPRYPMNSNPRGICLICSNTEFSEARLAGLELSDRIGSSIDVSKLNSVFTWLKFDVQIRHEMTADQMYGCLREYAEYNHKEFDCFVCCILTHGCLQGLYGTDGKILNIAEATQLFTRLNSATLQEKPKLFFLQCCRGFSTDNSPSIDVLRRSTDVLESDFFIGYPTPSGYAAWRTLHGGSWYVDTLCRVFQEHAHIEDLLSIMILVNSEISKRADPDDKKQVPQPMFSLRKMLYFNPESPFDADVNV